MSEAVNPNHDAESLPSGEPNPSVVSSSESMPAVVAAAEDDWQTVDFPGAIPVGELVQASSLIESAPDSAIGSTSSIEEHILGESNLETQDTESLQNLVYYLRRENSSLRSQVIQLEQDMAQVQVELQLEVARFYCKESETQDSSSVDTSIAPHPGEEGVTAQAQIRQLTQDLEQSQQTVQQQQQQVNVLTEQLASSQELIAHLERDCALSQQRYTDQEQHIIQLEHTCNDLRVRLNRQQQQTLQFKAALEKSLEMPPAIGSDHIISSDSIIQFPTPDAAEAQAFIPKAQPVQPWSTTADSASPRGHAAPPRSQAKELPNLLKLVNHDTPLHSHPSDVLGSEGAEFDLTTPPAELLALVNSAAPAEVPAPIQPQAPDLDALFPDLPPIAIVPDTPTQEAIFDLSPFLEAGEVDPAVIPAVQSAPAPEPIAPAPSAPEAEVTPNPAQENNLWADLARLIEPEMVTENAAISPDLTVAVDTPVVQPVGADLRIEAIAVSERIIQETEPFNQPESAASDAQFANPFGQPQPTFEAPWVAEMQPGSPFITVKSPIARNTTDEAFPEPAIPTVNSLEPTPVEASPGLPSPVLQPFRPAKKIKSMAAVDLPSFPRTAQ